MKKEHLYKYFAGSTSPDEEKGIIDWVEASPENYKVYLKERKMWNSVLVNIPSLTEDKTWMKKDPRKINFWKLTTVAASIALLFALFHSLFSKEEQEVRWQTVWVPPGQRVQVILDDSTVVWLNSRSTLKYPSSFNSDRREVQLNGEGYFEVTKDEKKPFIVQTSRYNVTVLGTNFNVFAYGDRSFFETALIRGSVQVSSNNHENIPPVVLKPNEKVTEINGKLESGMIDNFDHFRWKEGLICIDGESFGKMMEKFSLYFDVHIKIENPDLLEYTPTGKFRQSDGIDHALKVLQKDLKFTYTRDHELNEIIIK